MNPTEECNMVAGLTLPHGAALTKMTVYYRAFSTPEKNQIYLFRGDRLAEGTPMAKMQSGGNEFALRYLSVMAFADPVIDNQLYSYYLVVHFPQNGSSDIILANVRLDYDYPSFLPTVMK